MIHWDPSDKSPSAFYSFKLLLMVPTNFDSHCRLITSASCHFKLIYIGLRPEHVWLCRSVVVNSYIFCNLLFIVLWMCSWMIGCFAPKNACQLNGEACKYSDHMGLCLRTNDAILISEAYPFLALLFIFYL